VNVRRLLRPNDRDTDALRSYQTSVHTFQVTRRRILEEANLDAPACVCVLRLT